MFIQSHVQVVTHFFGEELFGETCDQVHGSNAVPLEYPFSTPLLEYPRSTPNPMTTPNVPQCRMPCRGAAQPLPRALVEDGTGFHRGVLAGYSRGTRGVLKGYCAQLLKNGTDFLGTVVPSQARGQHAPMPQ